MVGYLAQVVWRCQLRCLFRVPTSWLPSHEHRSLPWMGTTELHACWIPPICILCCRLSDLAAFGTCCLQATMLGIVQVHQRDDNFPHAQYRTAALTHPHAVLLSPNLAACRLLCLKSVQDHQRDDISACAAQNRSTHSSACCAAVCGTLLPAGYYAWNLYKSIKENGCCCAGKA